MGALDCRKCYVMLTDRIAQQLQDKIEATLSARNSSIDTHRKAMNSGPLCDRAVAVAGKVSPQGRSRRRRHSVTGDSRPR
jgi:hypothetical protein